MQISPTVPPFPVRMEFVASVVDRPIRRISFFENEPDAKTPSTAPSMPRDRSEYVVADFDVANTCMVFKSTIAASVNVPPVSMPRPRVLGFVATNLL